MVTRCASTLAEAEKMLGDDEPYDAVLLGIASLVLSAAEAESLAARAALVVVLADSDADGDGETGAEDALAWLRRGAEDVLGCGELRGPAGWRRVRFAIERRRRGEGRKVAYATDPATGLPHRQQLVEHLSQLLALREREPAPMAVVSLRLEASSAGIERADVDLLRRKVGVRLRAGVRASDVVAVAGEDVFVVLLGAILSPDDAVRVAGKLAASVVAPFSVGGNELSVAVAVGIAHYPQDGVQADRLLRRSLALAAAAPAFAPGGAATLRDPAGDLRAAANDER